MSKVIVIGGGVNGLVAATRLAQAGRQVTVLERRELLGGIAAGESFHPGYRHVGLSHDGAEVRGSVIKALGLESHGLRLQAPPGLFIAEREGPGLVLQEQGSELADRAPEDAAGLARWEQLLEAFRPAVRMVLQEAAPDVRQDASLWPLLSKGWMLRGIGEEYLLELLRVGPMCVDDWMAEYVADPLVRTGVIWPALVGAWMGPRSPYSATNLLMDSGAREWEVTGGPAALVGSLVSAAEAAGVRMLTGTEALGIELSAERVTGVRVDGEILAGDVLMTGAPTGLLTLLPAWRMPARMVRELENIRTRGTCAKLHLALNAPMVVAARKASFDHMLLGAEHPLDLERCFDDAKHRRLPRRPWLDVRQLTGDCAPSGHAVLSIMVHCAAHDLDGGWTPGAREALKQSVLAVLAESDPDIAAKVVHAELLAPSDLEQRYGLVGGHLFHGERMVDQWYAMRPSLHLSRHATDLPGLFLGSMGTHPGGGITGGPGLMAAERMLSVSGAS